MRRLTNIFLLLCVTFAPSASAEEAQALVEQSRELARSLGQSLKSALQTAMRDGGPVAAIQTCHLEAAGITAAQSTPGWTIRRTSLRVRNPDNRPDAWEAAVLRRFERSRTAGGDPAALEFYEVVDEQGVREFRWMKAIPTAPVCLACHGGDTVSPEAEAAITARYPNDQARGFAVGDIRGAFSVRRVMP